MSSIRTNSHRGSENARSTAECLEEGSASRVALAVESVGSVLIGGNDLTTGSRAEGPPGAHVDRRLDGLDRAVTEKHVDEPWVMAARDVRDLKPRSTAPRVGGHHVDVTGQGWLS